ncbi:hypothetical protein ACFPM0_28090 [Pseudonocardia sulfidoxydans]
MLATRNAASIFACPAEPFWIAVVRRNPDRGAARHLPRSTGVPRRARG